MKSAFVGRSIAHSYLGNRDEAEKDIQLLVRLDPNAVPKAEVPDVVRKSKSTAIMEIMDVGLFPVLRGKGETVVDQEPEGGKSVRAGSKVRLQLGKP